MSRYGGCTHTFTWRLWGARVSSGCRTDGHRQCSFTAGVSSRSSGGWRLASRASRAGLVGALLHLQTAACCHCALTWQRGHLSLRTPANGVRGPPSLRSHLTFLTFSGVLSTNTVFWGLGLQHMCFGGTRCRRVLLGTLSRFCHKNLLWDCGE